MKLIGTAIVVGLCQCNASAGTIIKDVAIGTNEVICLIEQYDTDISNGQPSNTAVADAAVKCNVESAIASTVLTAHQAGLDKLSKKVTQ